MLVAPDLEAGNILATQLTFPADADAAGIVLGARVPIVLASRADEAANEQGALRISPADAMPSVWVIPTDEERMIAMHTARLV